MAEGISSAAAQVGLDAIAAAYTWIKLHTGAPGAAGTSNAATETTRKQATWGAASGNALANTNAPTWTNVAGSEDYTHYSAWTANAAGTFGFSGTITAAAVTAGDTFDLPIGDIDLAFATLAS
jgi:hypothetical protein